MARRKQRTIRRQYTRPYIAHASIAPSCAMAQWDGDRVHVWTHSQGVYLLRADLALVSKLPVENITVEHMEGAGCYGHNAADDVALDAVLLARAAGGRPVRVQWSRAGRDVACAVRRGDGDRDRGRSRCAKARSSAGGIRSGATAMPRGRAAQRSRRCSPQPNWQNPFPRMISTNPPQANGGGADRNSIPLYDFPSWQIESHRLLTMPIRTSALRTLGAQGNVFAIESFLDEIAAERGEDPVAFRLRHLRDERAKDVIRAVATTRKLETREASRHRPRHRLCPLQEHRRLLCRGRRGRRRRRHPRQAADARGRCRRSHQSRWRDQPDRGRRDPGHQLGAEGARPLRPAAHHQHQLDRLSDPSLQRGAGGGGRIDPAGGDRSGRRRRSRAWPGHGGDRQRRVRCLGVRVRDLADHARQPDRSDGIGFMTTLNILSGGAAHGLVSSLAAVFKAADRPRHRGRVRRGRHHGRQVAPGHACRSRYPDRGAGRKACGREIDRSRFNPEHRTGRNRACGSRRRSVVSATDAARLAQRAARRGRDLRAGYEVVDGGHSRRESCRATRDLPAKSRTG